MTSRAEELARRLSTVHSEDPEIILRELVEHLRDTVRCQFGLYFKCVETRPGELYFTNAVTDGDRELRDALLAYADKPAVATPWLPPNLNRDEVNTFIRTSSRYDDDYLRNFSIASDVFEPLEVGDQIRILLYDGSRFLGWLGLMRRGRGEYFRRQEQQLLNQISGEIKSLVAMADALESNLLRDGLFAVLTPRGKIEHASKSFSTWRTPSRLDYLASRVRDADSGKGRLSIEIYEGAEIRLIRLDSTGMVRYLASVQRARVMTVTPGYWLTDRQQEIADYAVAGATSPEIADMLNLSPQTVKTHMKNIFRRLDINSRAELATLLTGD